MEGILIDKNYILTKNVNNVNILIDILNNHFYPFELKEDIPEEVINNIKPIDFKKAIKRFVKNDFENISIAKEIIEKTKDIVAKPRIVHDYSKQNKQLVKNKYEYEKYYNIKVNADNVSEKYYYDRTDNYYKLLDEFKLKCLIERDFTTTLPDESVIPICLTDSESHNLFGLFTNVTKTESDCINFKNCVLNTATWQKVNDDVFTVKNIYYDYKDLDCCEEDTLVERTLRQIFISKCGGSELYFNDFLERLGACFLRQNKHKFIYMLWGGGDDGKSIVLYIISLIFGNLALWTSIDSYTDKFFKVNLGDTQILLMDELNRNSFTQNVTAILKDITGRGATDSRVMYSQSTVKIKDYGVPFMATNIIPSVPFDDTAYWNRLHLVRLSNKFVTVNEEGDLGDNEYLKDEDLEEKLAADTDGIEWLISASINAYKECKGKFSVKQSITDTQFIYDGDNPIRVFVERFIIGTNNKTDIISNLEVKYNLLQFCVRNNINKEKLGVDNSNELSQEIGYKIKNKFKNIEKVTRNGIVCYKNMCLNINNDENIDEIKEEIKNFEYYIFGE